MTIDLHAWLADGQVMNQSVRINRLMLQCLSAHAICVESTGPVRNVPHDGHVLSEFARCELMRNLKRGTLGSPSESNR